MGLGCDSRFSANPRSFCAVFHHLLFYDVLFIHESGVAFDRGRFSGKLAYRPANGPSFVGWDFWGSKP